MKSNILLGIAVCLVGVSQIVGTFARVSQVRSLRQEINRLADINDLLDKRSCETATRSINNKYESHFNRMLIDSIIEIVCPDPDDLFKSEPAPAVDNTGV